MKFNWGTCIVIAFALFMSFILYFVLQVQSNKAYDHQMVTEEYYKKEKEVDSVYLKKNNARVLVKPVQIIPISKGIIIHFPEHFDYTKIVGSVSLYRASDEKLDQNFKLKLEHLNFVVPNTNLASGIWEVVVDWKHNGIPYMVTETVKID